MPHITINAWPGKTAEQKNALAKKIAAAVVEEFGSNPGHVTVGFREWQPEDWPVFFRDEIYGEGRELLVEPSAYSEPHFIVGDDIIEYVDAEGKVLALINYPAISDNTVEITHTEVDPSLQGQGIAGIMTARAAAYLKSQGKKVVPSCSYAAGWFKNNSEYSDMIEE